VALGGAGVRAVGLDFAYGMVAMGSYAANSAVFAVAHQDGFVYLATFGHGLVVVSGHDPTALQYAGACGLDGMAERIAVVGNLAVVGGTAPTMDRILAAYDITDPTTPQQIGFTTLGSFPTVGTPMPEIVADDRILACVASAGLMDFELSGGTFTLRGQLVGRHYDLCYEDDRVIALSYTELFTSLPSPMLPPPPAVATTAGPNAQYRDGYLFTPRYDDLHVLDLGDPSQPLAIATVPVGDNDLEYPPAALHGPTLSVANPGGFVSVMDVGDPGAPTVAGTYQSSAGAHWLSGFLVDDDLLYAVVSGVGLEIFDLADPYAPASVHLLPDDFASCRGMVRLGDQLLVAARSVGVDVYDLADPRQPQPAGYLLTGPVNAIAGIGEHLLVADGPGPLQVWRQDPDTEDWSPAAWAPVMDVRRLAVVDNLVYALDSVDNLTVLDVAVPTAPLELGGFSVDPADGSGLLATGDWFAVNDDERLRVWPPQCAPEPTAVSPRPVASPLVLQAAPNPCNPRTRLSFDLSRADEVRLQVFDLRGRLVTTLIDGPYPPGRHHADWRGAADDGRPLPSGVYHARLTAAGATVSRKLVLLK
jgi:hypothetical protein